jgi:DNA-binding transcriptional ArsR family regulator
MDTKRFSKAETASAIFDSLSHPTRLMIVCLLLEQEHYVQEIFDQLGTTKGNISQHLRILEHGGHITSRKEANRVYYRIADDRLRALVKTIQKLYCPGLSVK